ncbi:MAG: type II toxin-antitoxin system RelE/ParE family toxin [Gallionellaceae bacterium]|nr:type II toxin-antitoxin system RelE/ParE family toxin [Gallionellaceae bacterium]
MNYHVRYSEVAKDDLNRLFDFLSEQDLQAAINARKTIDEGVGLLRHFPFTCRKATPENSLLRELIITFGGGGYVALFEIEDNHFVTILAVRHQREYDYH